MLSKEIDLHYIGAATALLDIGGLRFLTDPAFDPNDTLYPLGTYTLHKIKAPATTINKIGKIDYILLSHDHHMDNLDHSGEQLLTQATTVFTTTSGAQRLNSGGIRPGETSTPKNIHAIGLAHWETVEVPTKDGRILTITGTPCRHGPVGGDRGPVTGFVLNWKGESNDGIYITGDTVWYEGVQEVANRFDIGLVLLFMGAAKLAAVGPAHLTMTVEESLKAARLFAKAPIVPLHFEGWEHFSEGHDEILRQYTEAGMVDRLHWAHAYQPS